MDNIRTLRKPYNCRYNLTMAFSQGMVPSFLCTLCSHNGTVVAKYLQTCVELICDLRGNMYYLNRGSKGAG